MIARAISCISSGTKVLKSREASTSTGELRLRQLVAFGLRVLAGHAFLTALFDALGKSAAPELVKGRVVKRNVLRSRGQDRPQRSLELLPIRQINSVRRANGINNFRRRNEHFPLAQQPT